MEVDLIGIIMIMIIGVVLWEALEHGIILG